MTDTHRLTIGPMLRAARDRAGLSQAELSDATGIDQGNISAAETRGKVWPAILDRFIAALDLDRDAAYHAAGRVPPELVDGLAHDLALIREVRERLGL